MEALRDSALLGAWDRGLGLGDHERAIELLLCCRAGVTRDEAAAMPLGRRDAWLLESRRSLFGRVLAGGDFCPECGCRVEFELDVDDVLARAPEDGAVEAARGGAPRLSIEVDDWRLEYRLPHSLDLACVAGCGGVAEAERRLMERCVLVVTRGGAPAGFGDLPAHVLDVVAGSMGEHDPLADIEILLRCPSCRGEWTAAMDIAAWLWSEIDHRARRLLREVHVLARAYGWREDEIVAMSPGRRARYLEMVCG